MMNKGLIHGVIFDPNGLPAKGVYVRIVDMLSDPPLRFHQSNYQFGTRESYTDSRGSFAILFGWGGQDIAEFLSPMWAVIVAFSEKQQGSYSVVKASFHGRIRCYPFPDISTPFNMAFPDITGIPELLDFSKGLIDAFRKLKSHPIWSHQIETTANYMVLGGAHIQLR